MATTLYLTANASSDPAGGRTIETVLETGTTEIGSGVLSGVTVFDEFVTQGYGSRTIPAGHWKLTVRMRLNAAEDTTAGETNWFWRLYRRDDTTNTLLGTSPVSAFFNNTSYDNKSLYILDIAEQVLGADDDLFIEIVVQDSLDDSEVQINFEDPAGQCRLQYGVLPPARVVTVGYSEEDADTTSHDVTLPSGIQSGDLLLLVSALDGTPTISNMPSGWSIVRNIDHSSGNHKYIVHQKAATGAESNFQYTTSASERSTNRCYRIAGHDPDIALESADNGNGSSSNSPEPPTLNPTFDANIPVLWMGYVFWADGVAADVDTWTYPDNQYNDKVGSSTTDGVLMAGCTKFQAVAGTENPTAIRNTAWASTNYLSILIAIPQLADPVLTQTAFRLRNDDGPLTELV